jgi:rhodanese-related sulfurtransferase
MLVKRADILRLCAEMAVLVALAFAVGVAWNHRVLMNAWSGRATATAPAGVQQVVIPLPLGLMQVKELFDKREAVMIDARDRNSFSGGHIKGAMAMPLSEAETLIPEFSGRVPKKAMLVIYCNGYACEDSVELGKKLIAAGYSSVYYFDGGLPAWRDAGYPLGKR